MRAGVKSPMKTILLFSILFCSCAIVFPSLGALTDADLNKIRLIVKDEVTAETAKINDKIDKLDARLRTVETDMTGTQTEITNLKGTFNNSFDDVQKNFDRQNNIIIACIGIPLAILVSIEESMCSVEEKGYDNTQAYF